MIYYIKPISIVFIMFISITYSLRVFSEIFDEFSESVAPQFVTPSRMASSYLDSPNSVARIEIEDLYLLGITSVTDALRLIPGMLVSDVQNNDPAIGYHGTNVNVPRRMEILYNSNSIYRAGYASLQWQRLPVDLNDLTAIEVVRGSNVVDFGSNAFSGTVNLIPAQTVLEPTYFSEVLYGSGAHKELWLKKHFKSGTGEYVVRFFHREEDGFEIFEDGTENFDYMSGDSILLQGELEVSGGRLFDFTVAANQYGFTPANIQEYLDSIEADGDLEYPFTNKNGFNESEEQSISATLKYSGSEIWLRQDVDWFISSSYSRYKRDQIFDLCVSSFYFDPLLAQLDASPNIHLDTDDLPLVLSSSLSTGVAQLSESIVSPLSDSDQALLVQLGQRVQDVGAYELLKPVCGVADLSVDEKRFEVELATSISKKNNYILSSNINLSDSIAESQHYLNGKVNRYSAFISNNLRYYISNLLVLNVGLSFEKNDRLDDVYTSYRTSLNWGYQPRHILRGTASHSERSPDIHEVDRYWNFYIDYNENVTDYLGNSEGSFPRVSKSPESLEPESIDTIEISYVYFWNSHTLDFKVFNERLSDLISEPFYYPDFTLSNNGKANMNGAELLYVFNSHSRNRTKFGFNYLYLKNESNTLYEKTIYSKNSTTLFAITPLSERWTLGSTVYYLDDIGDHVYERYDINLTYSKYYKDIDAKFRINIRKYPELIYSFSELSAVQPVVSKYEDNIRIFASLSIEY